MRLKINISIEPYIKPTDYLTSTYCSPRWHFISTCSTYFILQTKVLKGRDNQETFYVELKRVTYKTVVTWRIKVKNVLRGYTIRVWLQRSDNKRLFCWLFYGKIGVCVEEVPTWYSFMRHYSTIRFLNDDYILCYNEDKSNFYLSSHGVVWSVIVSMMSILGSDSLTFSLVISTLK